ncbi:hypothetical protein OICFNHDK_1015 [Methylobacterium bullatum]|uniref:Uncharacterized protein n=1 Tax=Methylobacterium bullatum TaxID=570505 RepID=A0A679JSZ1_9HYPH|nr:hypothetical protein OICFNHDK_1015 [Methylobacterium bullatum]CAA2139789.1 hypothetical protein MBLL_01793 [Methylobacterium bullatum]
MLGIGVIWAGGLARLGIYDQHDRLLTWVSGRVHRLRRAGHRAGGTVER